MFVPERKATQAGPILFRERPALHWWARDFVGFSLSDTLRLGKFYVVAGRGLSVLAEARHHFLLWPGATLPCSLRPDGITQINYYFLYLIYMFIKFCCYGFFFV